QQLSQARSTLATAQANLELAKITRDRYQGLLTKRAVAQQDVDNAVGTFNANKAVVDADMANVQRYQALVSFEKVYAPFDGVITARNTDIGDLINSGSSTAPRTNLFDIVQPGTLRVYVNVPEEYSRGIIPGQDSTFLIPVNTLIFRSLKLQVGVVRDGKVVLAEVTPGHDFGAEIEIVAGLKADDQVVLNPPDSLVTGQQVQIVNATLPGETK